MGATRHMPNGPAEISFRVRGILCILIVGISVNGGHQSVYDTKLFFQYLCHGGQAVGGAGSAADDGFAAIEDLVAKKGEIF